MTTENITTERAARRFAQMSELERQITIRQSEIANSEDHLKELKKSREGLLLRLREAARDEGELPLFNLND